MAINETIRICFGEIRAKLSEATQIARHVPWLAASTKRSRFPWTSTTAL
jgi:hypothetical protein